MDVGKQATVNGGMESAPEDGTIPAHIQVMLILSLNTFLVNGPGVGGLLHNLTCEGHKRNKLMLLISKGAYLNQPLKKRKKKKKHFQHF